MTAMPRPLSDVTVLDLSQIVAGPYCTYLMSQAGARVIKIEPPEGELYRREGAPMASDDGVSFTGLNFLRFSRDKESVVLDLKSEEGRRAFEVLVANADVLVENFKHDTLDRLGFGYERLRAINPRLVYTSISGAGHTDILASPLADWPALAGVAEALGGVTDRIGDPTCRPHASGVSAGDLYAGMAALSGTLMALHQRALTGEGQHVDISMVDAMMSLNERAILIAAATGEVLQRGQEADLAPFGPFRAADGSVVICVLGEKLWSKLCVAIDRPDLEADPRLSTGRDRVAHLETVLRPIIEDWLRGRTKAEAAQALTTAGVPAAPVLNALEVLRSPHAAARRMLVDLDLPHHGVFKVVASPIRMGGDPGGGAGRAPLLGEQTATVLRQFGAPVASGMMEVER